MKFSDLKAKMDQLKQTASKMQEKEENGNTDERLFKPKKDGNGNIACVIRFLPQVKFDGDEMDFSSEPYKEKWAHFIEINGKRIISSCVKNKDKCDFCNYSQPFWKTYWDLRNSGLAKDNPRVVAARVSANKYTSQQQVITNILVVKNPADPETEGKVFLYNVPKDVMALYKTKIFPKDAMDERVIVYDPFEGRNFKLDGVLSNKGGEKPMIDYKTSYFFDKNTPISEDEDDFMRILKETHDLDKYIEEKTMSEEDVKKKFNELVGLVGSNSTLNKSEDVMPNNEEDGPDVDSFGNVEETDIDDLFD